jgi:hypothetical protein
MYQDLIMYEGNCMMNEYWLTDIQKLKYMSIWEAKKVQSLIYCIKIMELVRTILL